MATTHKHFGPRMTMAALVFALCLIAAVSPAAADVGPSGSDQYLKVVDSTIDLGASQPSALARDMLGQSYVAVDTDPLDLGIADVVAVYDANGGLVTTYGQGLDPALSTITGITVDEANQQLLVADADNNRIVRFSTVDGSFVDSFGTADGLTYPMGVAVDVNGDIWVTDSFDTTADPWDSYGGRLLRFNNAGQLEATIQGVGADGSSPFGWPDGVVCDSTGHVYVADGHPAWSVHRFDVDGTWTDGIPAMTGAGHLTFAQDVEVDGFGTVYVLFPRTEHHKVVRFDNNFQYLSTAVDANDIQRPENAFGYAFDIMVDPYMDLHLGNLADDGTGQVFTYDWHSANDQVPPTTGDNITAPWRPGPFEVTLTASDTSSTVTSIYYSTDGSDPAVGHRGSTTSFWVSDEGTNTIKYFAIDSAGNQEEIRTKQLRLDNTPPTISTDATTAPYTLQATIRFAALDAMAGVSKIEWQLGNGDIYDGSTALIGVTNGTKLLKYQAFDLAGNASAIFSIPITVRPTDDQPPITYCNVPGNSWQTSDINVVLTPTDAALSDGSPGSIAGTYYQLDGSAVQTYTGSFDITTEGTHTLKYWSVDGAGNSETPKTLITKLDKTLPVTGSDVRSSYIGSATITLVPTDTVSGVQTTYWRLNNVPGSGNVISVNATGTHVLEYWSRDVAGNVEGLNRITLSVYPVDTNPPNIFSDLPPEGWIPGESGVATITLTVQDDVTGIKSVFWQIDGGDVQSMTLDVTENDPPVRTQRVKFPVSSGVHSVAFWAVDVRGNLGSPRYETARVDVAAPVTGSDVKPTYIGTATVTFTPNDSESGIMYTTYRYRLQPGGVWSQSNGTSFQLSSWGTYDLEYFSVDKAGNTEATNTASFAITPPDSEPPTTTWTGTNGWVKGSALVAFTASDSESSVKVTRWSTDGLTWHDYSAPFFLGIQGTTTISYYSVDVYNNAEDVKQAQITVDNLAPTTTNNAQASYVDEAQITLTPTDPDSGVASTWWRLYNGNTWTTPTSGTVVYKANDYRTFTLQYWSYDVLGNKEATQSATFRIRWREAGFENTDSDLVFREGWTLQTSGSASGGNYQRAETTGSVAYAYFQGSRLEWYGPEGTAWGKARVTVDGGAPQIVDCYSPGVSTAHNSYIWDTGDLEFGYHLVKIEALGDKNSSASTTRVGIDRFYGEASLLPVPDSAPPVTTAQAPSAWTAGSATVTLSATDATTGVRATYAAVDAQPSIANTYTAAIVVSSPGTHTVTYYSVDNRGNVEATSSVQVRVDTAPPVTTSNNALATYLTTGTITFTATDGHSGVAATRYSVDGGAWTTGTVVTVPNVVGAHTIDYYSVDNAGNQEGSKRVNTAVVRRFEETSPELAYRGAWEQQSDVAFSANALRRAQTTGSVLYVAFTGTGIDWYAYKGLSAGIASVSVDGGAAVAYDLYSFNPTPMAKVWGVSGLANGTHLVKIEFTGRKNMAANATWVGADFFDVAGALVPAWPVADTNPPVTSVTAPSAWVTSDAMVSLSATDSLSGVATTFYRVNGGAETTYTAPFAVSVPGTSTVQYWSVDQGGNVESPLSTTVRVDKTPPSTTHIAPTGWVNTPPVVTLLPADGTSGVSATWYRVNGGEPTLYLGPVTVPSVGVTSLQYWSVDLAGNTESPSSVDVHYDVTPPSTTHDSTDAWTRGPATITFAPTDALSDPCTTFVGVDGADPVLQNGPLVISAEGTHSVSFWSVDGAGNAESPNTLTVRVDDTAPETTHNSPTSWVQGPVAVTLTSADALSGPLTTMVAVNGADPVTYDNPVELSAEGTYDLAFWSVDQVGNREETKTATVRIDLTAPVTTSDLADSYHGPSPVTFTATDPDAGVGFTEWRVDDGEWTQGSVASLPATPGRHVLSWRSTDAVGNQEEINSAAYSMYERVEQTDPLITYRGEWYRVDNQSLSSSSMAKTTFAGTGVYLTFHGTGIEWIALKSTKYGIAKVTLDGGAPEYVDLYDATAGGAWKEKAWSASGLSDTDHVVKIEWTGTKSGAAEDFALNVDAFEIAGTLVPDSGAPTAACSATGVWRPNGEVVSLTASDTNTYVSAIRYRVNGGSVTTYTAPFTVSTSGSNSIEYWSVDALANESIHGQALVRIDRALPTGETDAPSGWTRGPVTVHVNPSDADSGVSYIVYSADGTSPNKPYGTGIPVSAEGVNTVKYRVIDVAGNSSPILSSLVKIDNTAPVSSASAPSEWQQGSVAVTLSATDTLSGVAGIRYSVDGSDPATYTNPVSLSDEGAHSIQYFAVDEAGNVESSKTVTVRIDKTAPVTTSALASRYSGAASVSLTATDTGAGVAFTEWKIDEGVWTTGSLASLPAAPGPHTLWWRSTDAAGNVESPKSAVYSMYGRVEQTDPRIYWKGSWYRIDNASLSASSTMKTTFSGTAAYVTFRGTGIDWIALKSTKYGIAKVTVDGGAAEYADLYDATTGGAWKAKVWGVSGLSDTVHTLKIEWTGTKNGSAEDYALNIDAFDVAGTVVADTDPPVSAASATGAWRNSSEVVTLTASDAGSYASVIKYRLNGGAEVSYSAPFTVSSEGVTTITYYAVDGAGNIEQQKTATVKIDKTSPTLAASAPSGWQNSAVSVQLTGGDPLSGIASILYSLDGSEPSTPYGSGINITEEGTTTVRYKALDVAGNASAVGSTTVAIDMVAPTVTDNMVPRWSNASIVITGTDSMSGYTATYLGLDGSQPTTYTAAVTPSDGVHTVAYYGMDAAGNKSTEQTRSARIDRTAPITTATLATSYYATSTVSLVATDAHSGVDRTEWRIDASTWTTGSVATLPLTAGRHSLQWRSYDAAGNVEQTQSATYDMYVRVEQTDSRIYWKGEWYRIDNKSLSGESMMKTTFAGTGAYVTFRGTGISWVALKSAGYGIAKVTLDGGTPEYVNLYDATVGGAWQKRVWSASELSDTDHTLAIEWTGTKDPSANTPIALNIDAFDVAGTMTDFRTSAEDSDSRLYFDAAWFRIDNQNLSSGTMRKAVSTGTASFTFRGTGFDYTALKSPRYGFAAVTVDGTTTHSVDLYDADANGAWKSKVLSVSGLTDTTHTVTIAWTGQKNANATGNEVNVDSISVRGILLQFRPTFEQTDPRLWFGPDWYNVNSSNLSGGSMLKTNEPDSPAFVSFKGTEISWVGLKTVSYGKAKVTLDGGAPETVDLYASSDLWKSRVWTKSGLSDTTHTVTIEWLGSKNASSTGTAIGIDGFEVVGTLVAASPTQPVYTRFDQVSSKVAWAGAWFPVNSFNVYGGSLAKANTTGDTAYVSFTGTAFKWLAVKTPSYGIARVRLDGGAPQYVNLYSPTDQWKSKVWSVSGLANTQHTLTIEWTGSKDASSSGTAIAVDGFDIIGTLDQAAASGPRLTRYEEGDSRIAYSGIWAPASSRFMSLGTAMKSVGPAGSTTVNFTGTELSWIGLKTSAYGIARVTVDGGTPELVDLYALNDQWMSRIWHVEGLADTPHTVTIEWTGTKNPAAKGDAILVDAIDVMGTLQ